MAEASNERSNSVIQTSLTELAFIFFFILLIVSALKMIAAEEQLNDSNEKQEKLEEEVSHLSEELSAASELFNHVEDYDSEELFQELIAGRQATEQLTRTLKEKAELEQQLQELAESLPSEIPREELMRQLAEYKEVREVIDRLGDNEFENTSEAVTELAERYRDTKGQNINLRKKLSAIGSGLDHPPCWADSKTGSIQYVFDVIINEEFVEFKAGWPDSRAEQALNNSNISNLPGTYSENSDLWARSQPLFEESVANDCRHFVRIYDHAESKRAFKNYLRGVENHFYKFLSVRKYE